MEYMSEWMEMAVKSRINEECRFLGIKKHTYLDYRIVDSVGGVRHILAVIKHKFIQPDEGYGYNVTILSLLTYADWTISGAEVMGHCTYDHDTFWRLYELKSELVSKYLCELQKELNEAKD